MLLMEITSSTQSRPDPRTVSPNKSGATTVPWAQVTIIIIHYQIF
jgi:hypothetical protein